MSELVSYQRLLDMALPSKQSAFLWGARKTGKSTFLQKRFPNSLRYDLLQSDLFFRLLKEPHLLREELIQINPEKLKYPVIIDEIQKIPALLNEIHWLIENKNIQFILCGSSARQLKREHANLLGGRAWRYELYPLCAKEIPDFNLVRALNQGLIPSHYLSTNYKKSLKAYVQDYLKEEIRAEGLARNLPAFSRFLDSAAYSQGELVNFSNIARECGVDSKTVREYYEILQDTHLGYLIEPYRNKKSRQILTETSKFYFFDTGLANFLTKNTIQELRGEAAGRSFEHWILLELLACRSYKELDFNISYWRTKSGLEVDFILGSPAVPVEVKVSDKIYKEDLKGLIAFIDEYHPPKALVVCNEKRARKITLASQETIEILPWKEFLEQLWVGTPFV